MNRCPDLTVKEIVADPIVRALMSADRVDTAAFEALLRSVAKRLVSRGGVAVAKESGRSGPAPSDFQPG